MRSTKRYSNNRSIAVWRPGNSEKASENKSCRVGPGSGGVERKDKWFWKRRDERIQHSGAKFDRRAHEFGSHLLWAVKTM
jgi:hypothetical protein